MNAPPITVEDFKNVLLDVYLLQRETAMLRAHLEAHTAPEPGGEEVTADDDAVLRHP